MSPRRGLFHPPELSFLEQRAKYTRGNPDGRRGEVVSTAAIEHVELQRQGITQHQRTPVNDHKMVRGLKVM